MITSQEINAMIAMQGQGVGYPGMPVAGPVPGASQYPPQFSYAAPIMQGRNIGQAVAGGFMNSFGPTAAGLSSAAFNTTAIAGLGAMGAGMLGMGTVADASKGIAATGLAGRLGAIESSAFLGNMARLNPLNSMIMSGGAAAATAFKAGGMLGTGGVLTGAGLSGIGTAALAGLANPYAIAGMIMAAPAMGMYTGARQYGQTASMLEAYNTFANPFAASGRGFSDNQMGSMVSQMRAFQAESPFISMRDMQQSMTRFNEMGMNQGERDAQDFSKKFLQMTKSLHAMSKMMGATMDEAAKVFGQMRGAGFYSGADVMQNTRLLTTLRGQGISGDLALGAQTAGGGITRAGGLGTTPGAKAVGGVMSMFTGARGVGALTNEEMMNITGAATPDQAIAQLSTSVTGSLTNFYTQTGVGQAMLAALGETDGSGRFTGGLDAEMIERLRTGQININNLVGTGRSKVSTRDAALSFKTRGQDVAGSLLSQGDPTAAIGAIMQSVAGDKFNELDPENLISLLTERIQGLSRKEAEAMTKLYREGEKIRRESQQQMRAEMNAQVFATDIRERHSFEGYKRRVLGGIADAFAPLQEMGQGLSIMGGRLVQRGMEDIFDITRVQTSNDVVDARRRRLMEGRFDESGTGAVSSGITDKTLQGYLQRHDYAGAMAEYGKISAQTRAGQDFDSILEGGDARGLAIAKGSLGRALMNYSSDIRSGKSARDILGGIKIQASESGFIDEFFKTSDSLSIEEYLTAQDTTLGGSAEQRRQALVDQAMGSGRPEIAAMIAQMGTGNILTMEQVKERGTSILNKRGYFSSYTARTAYDTLMESGGLGAAKRLGAAGVDLNQLYQMTQEAYGGAGVTGTSQGYGRLLEALKAKGVDVTGLTKTQLDALMSVAGDTGAGRGESLSAGELTEVGAGGDIVQSNMDIANLTALATASSERAYEGIENAYGADELAALAGATTEGDIADKTSKLLTKLEEGLGTGELKLGDLGKEGSQYGEFGKTLAQLLQTRKSIAGISVGELSEADRKTLARMGFSKGAISSLGPDIDSKEFADLQTRAEQGRLAELTGGATGGMFTDTTQTEAVKYYRELAGSVAEVTSQVMVMQERERAYQAERGVAPLSPNAAPERR